MKAWLQLFRVPNLFTVPGDVIAGCLLATEGFSKPFAFLAVLFASLFFYAFGLVLNDLMDLREDTAERPSRPLPSGAIKPQSARIAAWLLAIAGLLLCACAGMKPLIFGAAVVAAVTAYNCYSKKNFFLGPVNMGLCRGLNVLLGASLAPVITIPAFAGAFLIGAYILAVSFLARTETKNPAIPPLIGKLIRALIFVQAILCAFAGSIAGWACALILALALWPLSSLIGRKFYSS